MEVGDLVGLQIVSHAPLEGLPLRPVGDPMQVARGMSVHAPDEHAVSDLGEVAEEIHVTCYLGL